MLRHMLSRSLLQRSALRFSLRTCIVVPTSSVQYSPIPLSLFGPGFNRSYSTDPIAVGSESGSLDEPVRPEHAVISTFDLFSIGGKLGYLNP